MCKLPVDPSLAHLLLLACKPMFSCVREALAVVVSNNNISQAFWFRLLFKTFWNGYSSVTCNAVLLLLLEGLYISLG